MKIKVNKKCAWFDSPDADQTKYMQKSDRKTTKKKPFRVRFIVVPPKNLRSPLMMPCMVH